MNVVAALVAFLFAALGASLSTEGIFRPAELLPGTLLSLLASVALFLSARWPRTATLVATGCEAAACAAGYLPTPLLLAPLIGCLYRLTVLGGGRTAGWWTGFAASAVIVGGVASDTTPTAGSLLLRTVGVALWLLPAVLAGRMTRAQRAYLRMVQARAEDAERGRDDDLRRRLSEERLRIARDLHDVVAHHLTVANAQAGTAAHLLTRRPEQTHELLLGLRDSTSAALRELKATVGLLRMPGDDSPAGTTPAPGLDQLPALIETCRAGGLEVSMTTGGTPRPLPPLVEVTAYRIIQEALTNATKHAVRPTVTISLAYGEDTLSARVVNTSVRPGPAGTDGYGLIGMRERALAVGGSVESGPAGPGRYAVALTIPLAPWQEDPALA
ncbi:sensor histidine kinase [Paractinoplanes brasiliensis]|uniref:histidine kinase n=1 Tax=Paractinoplanes brasiliensis TaxID=52695 RepID=A0A4R6JPD5_9ACTN|nr:histidine kinase [Actinoplanes brasiliensis]TDO36475.1 signal transduction histidine kinase [Actinoplanes brasiliensis]GID32530.1 two-component sensor histidine kinase [Actinoplanes brasiliensis]